MNKLCSRTLSAMLASVLMWVPAGTWANTASPGPARIAIKDFMFAPTSLKIKAGTAVMWINEDDEPHTVVSETGLFRSGGVDTKETFVFTFEKPGTYHFICTIHPKMVGTVVVE
jgi:plastocyanin